MLGGRCKSCMAPIVFLRTQPGGERKMPVDQETIGPNDTEETIFDAAHHRSHFATCPHANEHRKPRRHSK